MRERKVAESLFEHVVSFGAEPIPEIYNVGVVDTLGPTCWRVSKTEVWMMGQVSSN